MRGREGGREEADGARTALLFYQAAGNKSKKKLKIENNTLDQALLSVRDWENYVRQESLNASDNVEVLCKMLCRKGCVANNRIEF